MKCSIWDCDHELVPGKEENFTTWDEDICDPNNEEPAGPRTTYRCPNPECIMNKGDFGFWDERGAFYSSRALGSFNETYEKFKKICKENDPTAMDSYEKQFDAEKQKRTKPLNLYFTMFHIDYRFKADTYGKRHGIKDVKLQCSLRQKDGAYTLYISGIHMLFSYFHSFYYAKKAYLSRPYSEAGWWIKELKEDFYPPKSHCNTKSWYRRLFMWYINIFENKLKSLLFAIDIITTGEPQLEKY